MAPLVLAAVPLLGGGIVQLLIVIVVLGVCLWLVQQYVPMAAPIKTVLTVVVVLLIVLMILRTFAII